MTDEQAPAERGGPREAAWHWLSLVAEGDLEAAWRLMDKDLRWRIAQEVSGVGSREILEVLADVGPVNGTWPAVDYAIAARLMNTIEGLDVDSLGVFENTRVLGLDLEAIGFMESGVPIGVLPEGAVADITFQMRLTDDGWLVRDVNRV